MCLLNLKYELLECWICRNLVFSDGKYILVIINITYHMRLLFLKHWNLKLLSFKSLIQRWHKVLEHYVISLTYFSYYMAFKSECCFFYSISNLISILILLFYDPNEILHFFSISYQYKNKKSVNTDYSKYILILS